LFFDFLQPLKGEAVDFNLENNFASKPEIPEGVYLGAIIPEGLQTFSDFNAETGVNHAVFCDFFKFPNCVIDGEFDKDRLVGFLASCRQSGAMAMVTVELPLGFDSYANAQVESLALIFKSGRVPVFLRWAHEMNGSWYAWGQQPERYVNSFRNVSVVMKSLAENVAMTWTPNQGWGYPWPGGNFSVQASSPDFLLLDTDKNGVLDESDDPYLPFYPGDDVVDWVGHSFYHWSNRLERGYNETPSPDKWAQANGIGNPMVNFHEEFAVKRNKPMMIAETSAFFDTADTRGGGGEEAEIKTAWIRQVYNESDTSLVSLRKDLPKIGAIFWFNVEKFESETSSVVDWRLSKNSETAVFYNQIVKTDYFIKAKSYIIFSE
jgi:hypothetical protein